VAASLTLGWSGTLAAGRLNANVVQGITNDTNVTGSIATQTLTLGWTGTLSVARGGIGVGTLALNGVLFGNATSAVQATAQGAANTVLTANAGAPVFSAAPVIGTSVTTPIHYGGSAAGSTLTLQSTSSGVPSGDYVNAITGGTERARIDGGGNVNIGNAGAIVNNVGGVTPRLQISGLSDTLDLRRYSADANAPTLSSAKSRGAAFGTNTSVSVNDQLLVLNAGGYDATGTPVLQLSSRILFEADAAPTAGSVAGRTRILTAPSGSTTPTERWRVNSAGQHLFSNGPFNPGSNATGLLTLSGSFGGGIVFSDTGQIGLWSTSNGAALQLGVGGTSGGITAQYVFTSTYLQAPAFRIGAQNVLYVTGNYTAILSPDGTTNIQAGNASDKTIYLASDSGAQFQNSAGTVTRVIIGTEGAIKPQFGAFSGSGASAHIDMSSGAGNPGVSINTGSNAQVCGSFRAFLIVFNETGGTGGGEGAMFLITTAGGASLVFQTGTHWQASASPSAGNCGVASGANGFYIYNNCGTNGTFRLITMKFV
jgi:hypothetical protein